MMYIINFLSSLGKMIGAGKTVVNISTAIAENSAERRRQRALDKKADKIENRSIFVALILYVLATFAAYFVCNFGIVGIALTIVMVLIHCNKLKELGKYANIKRECILTVIMIIVVPVLLIAL